MSGLSDNNYRAKTTKASTSGWAAFDHKQRQKQKHQPLESQLHSRGEDDYPLLSASTSTPDKMLSIQNGKSFSSVVAGTTNFPSSMVKDLQRRAQLTNSSSTFADEIEATVPPDAFEKLNQLHPRADQSLIQDVLAAVNNNTQQALSILESMLISEDGENAHTSCVNDDTMLSGISTGSSTDNYTAYNDEASTSQLVNIVTKPPLEPEPEWEEDDIYVSHRQDAIRMMRLASRHSKAANNAYVRGDRLTAHHLSLRAQEEWTAAETFNARAAKEILNIRNDRSDLWRLDLHGLHASEAIQALQERLEEVESIVVSSNGLAMPPGDHKESNLPASAYDESVTRFKAEKFERRHLPFRQRPRLLQVITGKGNHSRGEAALPSAIRNFLSENWYHFDETRPGVIAIRPKFRQQRPTSITG